MLHPIRSLRAGTARAFTLIELLVVVAIISLLAAILFPVFSRARENARRTTCASNEKQMGLGFVQYAQDYDETFPTSFSDDPTAIAKLQESWDLLISPYLGQKVQLNSGAGLGQILQCPDDNNIRIYGNSARSYSVVWGVYVSYAVGAQDGSFAGPYVASGPASNYQYYSRGRRLSEFPAVATTLMLTENPANDQNTADFNNNNMEGKAQQASVGSPNLQASLMNNDVVGNPYHEGGWNYLFVDGHVKWELPQNTIGTGTMANPKGMWTIADGD